MSVIYKARFTRPSLNHMFVHEDDPGNSRFPLIVPYQYILMKNHSYEELISWDEVFQRKQELRPDLRYKIDFNNLTVDMMEGYGPRYNPFSLTCTEIWEYDSWEDAMTSYDNTFTDENIKWFIDQCRKTENSYVGEHYINGVKVEDWVPKFTV